MGKSLYILLNTINLNKWGTGFHYFQLVIQYTLVSWLVEGESPLNPRIQKTFPPKKAPHHNWQGAITHIPNGIT